MKSKPSRVFLSHAGSDSGAAARVADTLRGAGLEPILDRERLATGQSFVAFMEEALSTSDFCFLLWSQAAARGQWVQVEWEAALVRSVDEARAFLAVGRLDAHPLPSLLTPRLYVELHPEIEPGLSRLIATWTDDRAAESQSGRKVGSKASGAAVEGSGDLVYVTSELFGITCPWRADLDAPGGLLLDDVRARMELPVVHSVVKERIGIRFEYNLAHDGRRLDRGRPLAEQGVAPKSILWIETELKVDAAADPVKGELAAAWRGTTEPSWFKSARDFLVTSIRSAGLAGEDA